MAAAVELLAARSRSSITPSRVRAVRHGLIGAGVLLGAAQLLVIYAAGSSDAASYWSTDVVHLYQGIVVGGPGYAYSPAFAEMIQPLTLLPWPVFRVIWLALALGALAWLAIPVPRDWRLPFVLLCLPEAISGNINLLIPAAIAVGLTYPASWSFVFLTKVTPGVGFLWHAVRSEWRAMAVGAGTTLLIATASYLWLPDLWPRWIETLWTNRDTQGLALVPQVPILIRLPVAALVVAWGARSNRRWTVAVAATMALPHIYLNGLTVLAAIPRLAHVQSGGSTGAPSSFGTID